LCRRLTGGTARGMEASALFIRGGTLVLALQPPARPLYGAGNGKDVKVLADWLGLAWRVETDDGVLIEHATSRG
jgi:exopolyphosphatase/guanosine-5'-triphosphate,3'-diphosphate pyrophosphatase